MSDTPKTYTIATLADIWALPDATAMRRCLEDLARSLPAARALSDATMAVARALAEEDGVDIPSEGFSSGPRSYLWTDDGIDSGEIKLHLLG